MLDHSLLHQGSCRRLAELFLGEDLSKASFFRLCMRDYVITGWLLGELWAGSFEKNKSMELFIYVN